VLRPGSDGRLDIAHRLLETLAGQRVHEVRVHRGKEFERRGERSPRIVAAVHPPQGRELLIIEALHADRQPVHARVAKAPEALDLERSRVRLHRDLGARVDLQARADRGDEPVDRGGLEEARRSAADENRVERAPPHLGQVRFQVGHEGVDVLRFRHIAACLVRIEIAIRALADAPRDVDVERKRRKLHELHGEAMGAAVRRAAPAPALGGSRDSCPRRPSAPR